MSRRRIVVIGALVAVLIALAYAGWSVWRAQASLLAARDSAASLKDALSAGDQPAAEAALADLQADARSARRWTHGPAWAVLTWLPGVGDDASAIGTLADSADRVARDGLPGLVSTAGVVDGSALTPRHGRVDLSALAKLRQPVAEAQEAFRAAADQLGAVDRNGLVGALQGRFAEASNDVSRAADALDSAARAVDVLPSVLGDRRPQTWLLVFQNNAEVRATGGLPGAITVVRTDHGKVTLAAQRVGNQLGHRERPVLPLTRFEKSYYGPQLGTYFLDANVTPDFPRAAELWAAWWRQDTGQRVDGVIAVDPVTLSYLLGATGPVPLADGKLTADNAVDLLLHDVYVRFPDPAAQDAYFADVASRVFSAVTGGAGSSRAELEALARAAGEHRLLVHSFDADEQALISGTPIAGELDADAGHRVDIALNDATAAKMQYFLRYGVTAAPSCAYGRPSYDVTMTVASNTPADIRREPVWVTGGGVSGTPVGSQLVSIDVYGPAGGRMTGFAQDGVRLQPFTASGRGRVVAQLPVELKPGRRATLTWTVTPADAKALAINVTPGVARESESSLTEGPCDE